MICACRKRSAAICERIGSVASASTLATILRSTSTSTEPAIRDSEIAGFGGKPGQESLTKVRPGLCDAKLVWDDRKAAAYVERLRVRGYMGEIVKVTA